VYLPRYVARALPIQKAGRENDLARFNRVNGSLEWSLSRHGAGRDDRQRYREPSNQSDEPQVTNLHPVPPLGAVGRR
jgi:hypothetical protein